MDDFIRLFGPGGVFDQFFTQNVRQYADITSLPWRPVATDGLPPPICAADLVQFQRARAIRDAFFPGVASIGLRFELVPRNMDPGAISGDAGSRGRADRDHPQLRLPADPDVLAGARQHDADLRSAVAGRPAGL